MGLCWGSGAEVLMVVLRFFWGGEGRACPILLFFFSVLLNHWQRNFLCFVSFSFFFFVLGRQHLLLNAEV